MAGRRRRLAGAQENISAATLSTIAKGAKPLRDLSDLDPLLDFIGDARYVLLGEASHGTHEFYTWRDLISRRLITEKEFSFIAVEGDWPDCYRVNRYVKGYDASGDSARDVLHSFQRWPTWMWANEEVIDLVEWLRRYNTTRGLEQRAGFYGLDVYSLWDSLYQILGYLQKHSPEALPLAQQAFRCFEPYGEDVHDYAKASHWLNESCEQNVLALLTDLNRFSTGVVQVGDGEGQFNAQQNALVVKNAEQYYRTMVQGGPESWNIRDLHMMETLDRLMEQHGPDAKAIVWEHNTHIGDARFTDMADDGMFNVGQLVRERHADEGVVLVGFGSYRGSVLAGEAWDAPMQVMRVPPAKEGSWEDVLHRVSDENKLLLLSEWELTSELLARRGQRAIGVVYDPDYEWGNYVPTVLPRRYDAFLFIDSTRALQPLHDLEAQDSGEVPETFPYGV